MTIIDQKVREKLADITREFFAPKISEWRKKGTEIVILPADELALAILQSPDLRVTLVEPRYYVSQGSVIEIIDRIARTWVAKFQNRVDANDYCDLLNSKESKS